MEKNLADLFECVADAVPDRAAVVCAGRHLTYAALEERANRLASHLAGAGIGPGDHVACYLYNGFEYLETMLAAYKLRAAAVNVNWRYVAGELAYLLADSDARAVVFDTRFGPRLAEAEAAGNLPLLSRPGARLAVGPAEGTGPGPDAVPYEDALGASSPERRFEARSGGDRYLLYTGGTTGRPKGVMWRHEDLVESGLGGLDGATTPDELAERARRGGYRLLPACPLMHGAAQWVSLAAFLSGGTVVLSPDPGLDARAVVRLLAAEQVSILVIVGDAVGRPLADALEEMAGEVDLSALRVILSSGAFLSPPVKEALLARLPGALIRDTYGSSESGAFAQTLSAVGATPAQGRFAGSEDAVVLDDDFHPVAPGSGRIGRLARTGAVALGYYNDPEKTAATFPVVDGVRYIVTGDHATVEADGTIRLLGRGSACINTGGEKVYPDEVEEALKSHPAVTDAMVVGVPDERFGERVVALVVFREPGPGPAAGPDLDAHVRRLLAGYKAPRAVVPVEAIERFPSGKPDYAWGRSTALERLGSGVIP